MHPEFSLVHPVRPWYAAPCRIVLDALKSPNQNQGNWKTAIITQLSSPISAGRKWPPVLHCPGFAIENQRNDLVSEVCELCEMHSLKLVGRAISGFFASFFELAKSTQTHKYLSLSG